MIESLGLSHPAKLGVRGVQYRLDFGGFAGAGEAWGPVLTGFLPTSRVLLLIFITTTGHNLALLAKREASSEQCCERSSVLVCK